jgi:predicted AlkP superfamily pyrophosphatase or phosphodiesterase
MRLLLLLLLCLPHLQVNAAESGKGPAKKIYWLIPSGLRADTGDFNVYKWAREGKLPNLKRMMDEGAYGYSVPDFPSSTPVNYATLITGAE